MHVSLHAPHLFWGLRVSNTILCMLSSCVVLLTTTRERTFQPFVLEFEVCNASEAPVGFEFDLRRVTVSSSGNDPLGQQSGDPASQAGGSDCSCDVQVSPAKAVAPPAGSIRCTVRGGSNAALWVERGYVAPSRAGGGWRALRAREVPGSTLLDAVQ